MCIRALTVFFGRESIADAFRPIAKSPPIGADSSWDPTRRGVLARLAMGDATAKELAEPYDMSVAAVSKHLKVLEAAGLISQGRESQWRPRHLEAGPLQEVFEWVEDYRRFWDKDRLGHDRTHDRVSALR